MRIAEEPLVRLSSSSSGRRLVSGLAATYRLWGTEKSKPNAGVVSKRGKMVLAQANNRLLLGLYGPTSSGKTRLSIELATRIRDGYGREPVIISADSRQVYRYMDIGTSKTSPDEMNGVQHEMIDVADPVQKYELESYLTTAREHINACFHRNAVPIIVGGTSVYVKALLEGWNVKEAGSNREALKKDFPRSLAADAHAMLRRLDKQMATRVHPNNYEGIINALAQVMTNSDRHDAETNNNDVRTLVFGLDRSPKEIDHRVAKTLDSQFSRGLFDEVIDLDSRYNLSEQIQRKKNSANQILHTTGYREFFEFAEQQNKPVTSLNRGSIDEIHKTICSNICAYTRRQRSAFKKIPKIHMIKNAKQATQLFKRFE